jgi:hypothetical protein
LNLLFLSDEKQTSINHHSRKAYEAGAALSAAKKLGSPDPFFAAFDDFVNHLKNLSNEPAMSVTEILLSPPRTRSKQ